jgi:hypothetical protein
MRGTASHLQHFVGYSSYVRRLRSISIDRLVNEYIFSDTIMRRDIYYTAGLYSIFVIPWFVHRHIYIFSHKGDIKY